MRPAHPPSGLLSERFFAKEARRRVPTQAPYKHERGREVRNYGIVGRYLQLGACLLGRSLDNRLGDLFLGLSSGAAEETLLETLPASLLCLLLCRHLTSSIPILVGQRLPDVTKSVTKRRTRKIPRKSSLHPPLLLLRVLHDKPCRSQPKRYVLRLHRLLVATSGHCFKGRERIGNPCSPERAEVVFSEVTM